MRSWKFLLPLFASTLCLAAQPDRITSPISSGRTVALARSVHPKAQPQYDRGAVEPSFALSYVTLVVAPSPSQQIALDQLLAQQQDRSSPNYHKWLTPEQYAERFGLSQNDVNKISAWLKAQGFTVLSVPRGRNAVIFSGTAAQVKSAFKTEIHRYDVNGEKHIANSSAVYIPAALNGVVTGIRGLADFRPKPMYVRPRRGSKAAGPHPSYTATISGETYNFLAPGDIATIYDINPLYNASTPINGAGQKLAIMGQTDIYLADLTDFRSGFNLPAFTCTTGTTGLITGCPSPTYLGYILLGTDPGSPSLGDLFESDLDLEWAGAIAPDAQIIFINAETTDGVFDALTYAIDNETAPVISMSYGICEAEAESMETELQQGNSEGITIMNSAGDTGSAACDYSPPGTSSSGVYPNLPYQAAEYGLAVNYPASSPEVTGVGGTSIPAADYTSAYWGASNGTTGGSALATLVGQEVSWNDDEAFYEYCEGNPSNSFCTDGGPPAVSGWVPITNPETAQEDIWISSGGGGVSNCYGETPDDVCENGFPRPTWQQAITIPDLTSPQSTYRFVPDVSLLASPNYPGFILCTPQEEISGNSTTSTCSPGGTTGITNAVDDFSLVGGTSASSPIFAAIVSLLNQYLASNGLGNINPTLYTLAASPSNGAFHQIISGNNNVYCQTGTPSGAPSDVICPSTGVIGFSASNYDSTGGTGYNLATGLGSVDANALALAWNNTLGPDFQLTASSLSPSSVPAGQSASATVTISPVSGSTGMVVNFSPSSCAGLPAGATCSFNPASVTFNGTSAATTALTISTPANMAPSGPTTITITPTNSSNTNATVSLKVTATTETFTLSSSANSYSVAVGGTAAIPVTVGSTTGFVSSSTTALPLTYTCSASPALSASDIACQISPGSGQPTNATAVTVSLVTTAPTSQVRPPRGGSLIFYALLLPGLFGVVFVAGSRTHGVRLLSLIVVLGLSTLWLGACGGGGSNATGPTNPGTPTEPYTVTVSATTGGAVPLTNSFMFTLNVTAQ